MEIEQDSATDKLRKRLRFKSAFVIAGIVVLIAVGVIAGLVPRLRQQAGLAVETQKRALSQVSVVSPKPGQPASGLPLSAEIKPLAETPIYARANGYLKKRLVDIGSHVEAGQLLAEIDTPELNQELARARAQLTLAEAALAHAKTYSTRWAFLLQTGSVSDQENADKQNDLKLKSAAAESARADVRRLENLQSFAKVSAPFAGIITARNIDTGDLIVAAGSKELFHLAQTRMLRVFVQVPQGMAMAIRPGQTAEMTLPEVVGKKFPAKVIRTAGVIAADSRTLLVEMEVDNSKEEILAGSYALVRFSEAKMEPILTLPGNTILFRAEGPQVGVVLENGKVEMRPVKLGRDFGQMMEVLAGVGLRDNVIVNPSDSLKTGALVSVNIPEKSKNGP